ncbi:DoxX family protein [Roseateles sp. DAIF2]|uniref:DoxX family protein n=1 Tax=Roseateles sp. DAIF2 TaxID=2714952 RepID=UPI0035300E47
MNLTHPIGELLRACTDPGLERPQRMAPALAALTEQLRSLALLGARLYVAQVFFLSGLTKLRDWGTTLALFEDEYRVPLLSPQLAAWLGTGGELLLPALLLLGLGGRFAAAGLSVLNLVAVLSLAEIAPAALLGHQLWGALLLAVLLCGAGRWSLDAWLGRQR